MNVDLFIPKGAKSQQLSSVSEPPCLSLIKANPDVFYYFDCHVQGIYVNNR